MITPRIRLKHRQHRQQDDYLFSFSLLVPRVLLTIQKRRSSAPPKRSSANERADDPADDPADDLLTMFFARSSARKYLNRIRFFGLLSPADDADDHLALLTECHP
jgi:hypothetical protein